MEEKRVYSTTDLFLAAFLELRGMPPRFKASSGRVTFQWDHSPELFNLISDFHSGTAVPVSDYVDTFKSLRSRMYSQKGFNHAQTA